MSDIKTPYLNGHMYEFDLCWLVEKILSFESQLNQAIDLKTIHYADPIQWDITTQYAPNTVVVDPKTGTAYMSKVAVPSGILLTNSSYWTVIFNYQDIYTKIMEGVAFYNGQTDYATKALLVNDLVWYGLDLYRVTRAIEEGGKLIPGTNLVKTSIESLLSNYYGRDRVTTLLNDTLNVSGDYTVNAGDIAETSTNRTIKVTTDREVDVDGNDSLHIDGASTLNVGGLRTEAYAGNKTENVTGTYMGKFGAASFETGAPSWKVKFSDLTTDLHNIPVSPYDFGYNSNATDHTDLLEKMVATGKNITLLGLTFNINSNGITLKEGQTLDGMGATLKLIANSQTNYEIVTLDNFSTIQNLNIVGDRLEHDYSSGGTHEWGYGIHANSKHNLKILNCNVSMCTGDGINLTSCTDVIVNQCVCDSNRRMGLTVDLSGKDIYISDSTFSNTKSIGNNSSTQPAAGVDCENYSDASLQNFDNIVFEYCTFSDNDSRNFLIADNNTESINNIRLNHCIFKGSVYGIQTIFKGAGSLAITNCKVTDGDRSEALIFNSEGNQLWTTLLSNITIDNGTKNGITPVIWKSATLWIYNLSVLHDNKDFVIKLIDANNTVIDGVNCNGISYRTVSAENCQPVIKNIHVRDWTGVNDGDTVTRNGYINYATNGVVNVPAPLYEGQTLIVRCTGAVADLKITDLEGFNSVVDVTCSTVNSYIVLVATRKLQWHMTVFDYAWSTPNLGSFSPDGTINSTVKPTSTLVLNGQVVASNNVADTAFWVFVNGAWLTVSAT